MEILWVFLKLLFQETLKQLAISLVKKLAGIIKEKSSPFSAKIRGWISEKISNRPKS